LRPVVISTSFFPASVHMWCSLWGLQRCRRHSAELCLEQGTSPSLHLTAGPCQLHITQLAKCESKFECDHIRIHVRDGLLQATLYENTVSCNGAPMNLPHCCDCMTGSLLMASTYCRIEWALGCQAKGSLRDVQTFLVTDSRSSCAQLNDTNSGGGCLWFMQVPVTITACQGLRRGALGCMRPSSRHKRKPSFLPCRWHVAVCAMKD
jgi:hypothetical protein